MIVLEVAAAPAVVDAHISPDDPAQFAEPLEERCIAGLSFGIVRHPGHKHADAPNTLRLLRARRERPRDGRAAEKCDELPPFQLIELHLLPASQGRIAEYRIGNGQSAGILEFCDHSWFCLRGRATARYTFGTTNAQIEGCSRPRPRHTWQCWS